MRISSLILAAAAATLAWSACAQPAGGDVADHYYSELAQQCPDKLLQYLSPADLRDGLDDWVSGLSQDSQDQVRAAERAQCSNDTGAACVNQADIGVADAMGATPNLANSICESFLRCRSQGDCDHAR